MRDDCTHRTDKCHCEAEDVVLHEKKRLEDKFDCDVTINLYKEGALLVSTDDIEDDEEGYDDEDEEEENWWDADNVESNPDMDDDDDFDVDDDD